MKKFTYVSGALIARVFMFCAVVAFEPLTKAIVAARTWVLALAAVMMLSLPIPHWVYLVTVVCFHYAVHLFYGELFAELRQVLRRSDRAIYLLSLIVSPEWARAHVWWCGLKLGGEDNFCAMDMDKNELLPTKEITNRLLHDMEHPNTIHINM